MLTISKTLSVICSLIILTAGLTACTEKKEPVKVDLGQGEAIKSIEVPSRENPLRIAIGSMITPREGYAYYKRLLDYIGEKMGRPVKLIDKDLYAEVNELLKTNRVDLAFICGGPYVDGHDEFGLELLVVPEVNGRQVYYSYIIVPADSPVKSFNELRGKVFAFADPDSNSGKLSPTYLLQQMNETPESFFKEYIFTYAHDRSIMAVAYKKVDGAAVDSLIWEYLNKTTPELTSKTRIIMNSGPYGIPPVVVPSKVDTELKNRLREILLNINNDEKGREILNGMMIDRFVIGSNTSYDSIREMKASVKQHNK